MIHGGGGTCTDARDMTRALPRSSLWLRVGAWIDAHPAIFFILWSLWLAVWYFGLGPLSFVFIHDTGDNALPYRTALAAAVANGSWGYWDQQKASGIDSLSILVSPFQPDVLLLAILPTWLAYGLITWAQRFVAGYFTFRLLKDSIRLDTSPALYAGIAYSLYAQSAINGHWAGFTLDNGFLCEAGLPFILWSLSCLNSNKAIDYLYASLLGLFFSMTGWFVNSIFLLPMIFFWQFVILRRYERRSALILVFFILAWVVSSLPFIYALILNVPLSHRADWTPLGLWGAVGNRDLDRYVYEKVWFVWGLMRDNAVPVGLLLIGIVCSRCKDRLLMSIFAFIVLCLAFQPAYGLIKTLSLQHVTFLRAASFDRIYLLVPFLLIIGAAVGAMYIPREASLRLLFQRILDRPLRVRTVIIALAIGFVLFQSCFVHARILYLMGHGYNFRDLYLNPNLKKLREQTRDLPPFRMVTVAQGIQHPAMAWVYGLDTADGYMNVYPKRYQQYWEQVLTPLISSSAWIRDYFHYWGSRVYLFSPFYTRSLRQLKQLGDDPLIVSEYWNLKLLSLANVRFVVSPLPLQDENLVELFRGDTDASRRWDKLALVARSMSYLRGEKPPLPLFVYENRQVLPRYFMVNKARRFDNHDELLTALQRADYNDLRSTAYILDSERIVLSGDESGVAKANTRLISYSSDRIVLASHCESDCILVIADNYSPFWKAEINGFATRIFPVHNAFQGIYVKAGENTVRLEYDPPYAIRIAR